MMIWQLFHAFPITLTDSPIHTLAAASLLYTPTQVLCVCAPVKTSTMIMTTIKNLTPFIMVTLIGPFGHRAQVVAL